MVTICSDATTGSTKENSGWPKVVFSYVASKWNVHINCDWPCTQSGAFVTVQSLWPAVDEFEVPGPGLVPPAPTDAKTLERLSERSYVRDWYRLGLVSSSTSANSGSRQHTEPFRITTVNSTYMMCRTWVIR
jgi:hypothetical protein